MAEAGNAGQGVQESSEVFLDLVELVGDFRRRWLLLLLTTMAGLLLAFLYLNIAESKYEVALRLTPSNSTQGGLGGALGRLGGLASMAGIRSPQGAEGATPFELYIDHLGSRDLAGKLVADPEIARHAFEREWDPATGNFHERPGPLRPVKNLLFWLAGQTPPPWSPPNAERMQEYLEKNLTIVPPGVKDPPITALLLRVKDPAYGLRLLEQLHQRTDADIRAKELERSSQYATYLAAKLQETTVVEHRISLSEALLEQQRLIMMATGSTSFAATPVEAPVSNSKPASPKVGMALFFGCLLGLLVGGFTVAIQHVRSRKFMAKPAAPASAA